MFGSLREPQSFGMTRTPAQIIHRIGSLCEPQTKQTERASPDHGLAGLVEETLPMEQFAVVADAGFGALADATVGALADAATAGALADAATV